MKYLNIIVSIKSHDVTCDSDCLQIKWKHASNEYDVSTNSGNLIIEAITSLYINFECMYFVQCTVRLWWRTKISH